MKKVVAINSSKRKKNTYHLLVQIKEILEKKDIEVEIISLYDYDIKDCVGCESCILREKCGLSDDTEMLKQKLIDADGIIISSPVYLRQVSGKLKTFIDRTCKWFHQPVLFAKPILSVATTKGSGLKQTTKYIHEVAEQWGAMSAGSIERNIRNIDVEVKEKELRDFVLLLNSPEKFSPTFANLMSFQVQKALATGVIECDKAYWEKMNWNDKVYFFDCNVDFVKSLIPKMVGKKISKEMAKSVGVNTIK